MSELFNFLGIFSVNYEEGRFKPSKFTEFMNAVKMSTSTITTFCFLGYQPFRSEVLKSDLDDFTNFSLFPKIILTEKCVINWSLLVKLQEA